MGRSDEVAPAEQEAETAVVQLRLFIAAYEEVTVQPESRIARQLEAARRAVTAYETAKEIARNAA
jgi:hypothetical protein